MTSDHAVVSAAQGYLPWLLLMPIIGCAAFTWDGIYIGATASKDIRNSMLWAVVGFFLVWGAGMIMLQVFGSAASETYGRTAMHILMAAYFAHLLARTLYLSFRYKTVILSSLSS